MRTLVISDLHLGSRLERDVLRRPEALAALLDALDGVGRLVLLGDVVELMERRATQAMAIAEPVLRAIGARLAAGREIILVPGNHDVPLVRRWLLETGGPARVDAPVPADATPALARVVGWLGGPPRVRVRYPGVWLGDRVWATHGHYLDRHLLPEGGYGVTRGLLGRVPRDGTTPAAYERSTSSLAGLERAMSRAPRPVTTAFDDIAEVARAATMPRLSRRVLRRRLAPVASVLLGLQMRRASLPALAHVVHRLGVDAEHVIFGHVHRLGPLPGDDLRRWVGPAGRPLMANTGAWVYESILVDHARPPHPYWPGGAIVIAGDGVPRAVRLLDHVDAATLQPPQTRAGRRPSST